MALIAVALAVACSPNPSPTSDPALAGIPKPAGATAVNRSTVGGTTTLQSFQVSGQSPQQVLAFYAHRLPPAGWAVVGTPGRTGATDFAGVWTKGNQKLRVTSSPFRKRTQFNLQLRTV